MSDKQQLDDSDRPELTTSGTIYAGAIENILVLRFHGDVRLVWCVALEEYCSKIFSRGAIDRFYVDLSVADNLDSTTLGVLAKLGLLAKQKLGAEAELFYSSEDIERLVRCMGFSRVFKIVAEGQAISIDESSLEVLDYSDCCENVMRDSVIDAHKTLMDISDDNKEKFQGLVDSLENKN